MTFGERGGFGLVTRLNQLLLHDDIFGLVAGNPEQSGEAAVAIEIGLRANPQVTLAAVGQKQADRGVDGLHRAPRAGNHPQLAHPVLRMDQGDDRRRIRAGAGIKATGDCGVARAVECGASEIEPPMTDLRQCFGQAHQAIAFAKFNCSVGREHFTAPPTLDIAQRHHHLLWLARDQIEHEPVAALDPQISIRAAIEAKAHDRLGLEIGFPIDDRREHKRIITMDLIAEVPLEAYNMRPSSAIRKITSWAFSVTS